MTDNRPRNRHREHSDQPTEGIDLERLRYFTQPGEGRPTSRHRRRRGDPPSGRIPGLPLDDTGTTDFPPTDAPVAGSAMPGRAAPRRVPPRASAPEQQPPAPARPRAAEGRGYRDGGRGYPPPARGGWSDEPGGYREPPRYRDEPGDDRADYREQAVSSRGPRYAASAPAEPRYDQPEYDGPGYDEPTYDEAGYDQPAYEERAYGERGYDSGRRGYAAYGGSSYGGPSFDSPRYDEPADDERAFDDPGEPEPDEPLADERSDEPARGRGRRGAAGARPPRGPARPEALRRRRRRRIALAAVMATMLVLVVGVGYYGARSTGMFESSKDYSDAAGTSDVIVNIPENSTLMDFGQILVDNGVVGSVKAFTDAAGGQSMSGGYFKMRKEIPARVAVEMINDPAEHRVGRMVVPEGLQLDSKKGVDGKTTPGIFEMIAAATAVSVNGEQVGVSVEQLERAAADTSPAELGVPEWAQQNVQDLTGDHRRIEGLIAPGTWETIDPRQQATQILRGLITQSATRLQQWGLLDQNSSGLAPYETLVSASVVEREVDQPDDYAKVARVILNRLDKNQRLEMDSTANYTADVTNIDLSGESYKADNRWNTYQHPGLPITPIGAVGERALEATERPAVGNWLYFVTVDRNGTTLFADTFGQHMQNRQRACDNKLLTTGCS